MGRTREIKKRMVAVQNIERITKTMQMIATAKFTAALQRAHATAPYTRRIEQVVGEVLAAAGEVDHPLLHGPDQPVKRELLLVISSDRGLCGAYNGNVLRKAIACLRKMQQTATACALETSGKKAVGFFKFLQIDIDHRHTIGDKPQYEDVRALADRFIDSFTAGELDAVRVCFMRYESNSRQIPTLLQLLPLKPAPREPEAVFAQALYEFSPSAVSLLDELLPQAVRAMLFQAINDAVVSEQIMRMVAMKAATENARELSRNLRRQFNRARQTQITTELMEVISGAAALE
jgi:F-type H+-transporting ATPase subunit gamma